MPQNTLQSTGARMSSIQTIRRWVSYVCQHYSPNTQILYRRVIWQAAKFLPKNIEDWKLEHIEHYLATLQGLAPKGYNAYLVAVKSFGRWCEQHGWPNPARKCKQKRVLMVASRVLSQEELDKVVAICSLDEKDTVLFLAFTGLRASEFLSLRPENVSSDQKYLRIIGKGKARVVPLNQTCRKILARHPHLNFQKSYLQLNRLCHRLAEKAGIPSFAPHALRHHFATALMQHGVEIYHISKALGHSSVTLTEQLYVHWRTEDIVGITDILDKK